MNEDFDILWERRKAWRGRCPFDDAELERRVLKAQESGKREVESRKFTLRLWTPVAAAACLLLVLFPLRVGARPGNEVEHLDVGGSKVYFICNCGCAPDETIDLLNSMIR